MKTPDAILQEIWYVKDTNYKQAGYNSQRFVEQLRERSSELRKGLESKLKEPFKPETVLLDREH